MQPSGETASKADNLTQREASRAEFWAGVRAELPILVGVVPFGFIFGVLALSAGVAPFTAQAMSAIIFAGSAQFVTTQLLATSAPWLVIVLSGAVVNLRHLLYSASIAPFLRGLRPGWKWLLAYLLTDEAYAVTITHYLETHPSPADRQARHWFLLGSGLVLWATWQASTAAGIFLGAQIPASWSLDFSLSLTFIALVVPTLHDRATVAAALAGGVTAIFLWGLPLRLGLVTAALVGILVGVIWDRMK